jgi:hypothetical protein
MRLNYVPLLRIQRGIQGIPRSPHRFREYLRTIKTADGTDVDLVPLLLANPMAKDHVTELLDALLALDVDGIGVRAASEATEQLADVSGEFRAAIVVADDLAGGGTNRYAYEFENRHPDPGDKRYWVTGILWSSEPPTAKLARETVLAAAFRTAYVLQHGPAESLEELMIQEGSVMTAAGCEQPSHGSDEL